MSDSQPVIPGTPEPAASAASTTTVPDPSPIALRDDLVFDIDGEQIAGRDLRTQRLLHRDYTQKRQADAEARRTFESEREAFSAERETFNAQAAQLREIVRDPNKLAQLYLAMNASQVQAPPAPNPEVALKQSLEQEVTKRLNAFEAQQQQRELTQTLDSYTKGLLKEHPELSAIAGIDEAIYTQALRQGPKSLAEAKEQVKLAVEANAQALTKAWEERAKRQAAEAAKATHGIERPGGQPPLPVAKAYKGMDDPERTKDVIAFFEKAFAAQ